MYLAIAAPEDMTQYWIRFLASKKFPAAAMVNNYLKKVIGPLKGSGEKTVKSDYPFQWPHEQPRFGCSPQGPQSGAFIRPRRLKIRWE